MLLKEGVPFVPAFVSADRSGCQEHYESLGFLNATVRVVAHVECRGNRGDCWSCSRARASGRRRRDHGGRQQDWTPEDILSELR